MIRPAFLIPACLAAASAAILPPQASRAFDEYSARVEGELHARARAGRLLLLAGELASSGGKPVVRAAVQLAPRDAAPCYLHDWIAAAFLPGGTIPEVKTVLTDFARHTEYLTRHDSAGPKAAFATAHSTRIAEVVHPGQPDEREQPPGTGHGFLWRLNSFWAFEERDGGVYLECRALSLTRDIPLGRKWAIGPWIDSLPRDSLLQALENTLRALQSRK